MKKTISIILAVIALFSITMSVPAYAVGIDGTLIKEEDAKQAAADYIGASVDDLGSYSCTTESIQYASLLSITVTADQYKLSFRYNGVSYKITVDPVGLIRDYDYNSAKLIIPKGASGYVTEAEAKAKATDAAGVNSSDAIFTSSKFVVEDYTSYYEFEFLGKTEEVSAKVNATVKSANPDISKDDKGAFIMFFIRLFAKIAALFG